MKKSLFAVIVMILATLPALAQLQYAVPNSQKGLNEFEPAKETTVPFDGVEVKLGGAFALQFQALDHENTAKPKLNADGVNLNQLKDITAGFNNATANMNIDAQLADGIRLELVTYLSSRHHTEAWVKGGYIQIDKLPMINVPVVENIMNHVRVKVGHMEINYGDAHFRRTDNGNAFFNPFVGNYIMDAFTTEIGGEVYVFFEPFFIMGGATSGLIKGDVSQQVIVKSIDGNGGVDTIYGTQPSFLAKVGFDKDMSDDLRIRLTGSLYYNGGSARNTLYGGDRAGSRYYDIFDNTISSGFTSGRFNPGFTNEVTSFVINPFIKFHGLEFFGNYEVASGGSNKEFENRTWTQIGADLLYRFGKNEDFYIGGRYNTVSGDLVGYENELSITRVAGAFGWFITPNILAKMEYVNQTYDGWKETDIYHGGKFNGIMLEGAIAF